MAYLVDFNTNMDGSYINVDGSDANVDGPNSILGRAFATILVVFRVNNEVEVEVVEQCRWGHPMRLTTSFSLTVK